MKNLLDGLSKKMFEEAILPRLVELAADDKIPVDLTTLNYSHFKEAIENFSKEKSDLLEKKIKDVAVGTFISEKGDSEEIYEKLCDDSGDVLIWEPFENDSNERIVELIDDLEEHITESIKSL